MIYVLAFESENILKMIWKLVDIQFDVGTYIPTLIIHLG